MRHSKDLVTVVAHRGLPLSYPENSCLGIAKAYEQGAKAFECDIQFTADGTAVLLHDDNWLRTADKAQHIKDTTARDLKTIRPGYRSRFGELFHNLTVSTLDDLGVLLADKANYHAFIEIKVESLSYTSLEHVLSTLNAFYKNISGPITIISYSRELIAFIQTHSEFDTGWILKKYDGAHLAQAKLLRPKILICNIKKLPEQPLEDGPWQWFIYDVIQPNIATELIKKSVTWIESNDAPHLIQALADET